MKFLVDMALPPALADWLKERGHDGGKRCDKLLVKRQALREIERVQWSFRFTTEGTKP